MHICIYCRKLTVMNFSFISSILSSLDYLSLFQQWCHNEFHHCWFDDVVPSTTRWNDQCVKRCNKIYDRKFLTICTLLLTIFTIWNCLCFCYSSNLALKIICIRLSGTFSKMSISDKTKLLLMSPTQTQLIS